MHFKVDVEESCKRHIASHLNNCSGFIRAVARDLYVFFPGASLQADHQVDFMQTMTNTGIIRHLGDGRTGETRAVFRARNMDFVFCGMTANQLQKNRDYQVNNGHVAIIVPGESAQGWPLAYWGSLGGKPGKRKGLNYTFRKADRSAISYFCVRL